MPTPPLHFPHLNLSDVPWNHDWEDGGEHWRYAPYTSAIVNRYKRAVLERAAAVGIAGVSDTTTDTDNVHGYPDAPGDYSLVALGDTLFKGIRGLQNLIDDLYTFCVEPTTYGGTWTPTAVAAGFSYYTYSTPWDIAEADRPSAHFRRKSPREISSFADAGTEGQVARLLNDPVAMPTPPAGTRFGWLYKYTSGAWVLQTPAMLSPYKPDVLDQPNGRADAGDYWGPWLLNDLRDQINRMVAFKTQPIDGATAPPFSGLTPLSGASMYQLGWSAGDATTTNWTQDTGHVGDPDHTLTSGHTTGAPSATYEIDHNTPPPNGYLWFTKFAYMAVRTDGYSEGADNFPPDAATGSAFVRPEYNPLEGRTFRTTFCLYWYDPDAFSSMGSGWTPNSEGSGPTNRGSMYVFDTQDSASDRCLSNVLGDLTLSAPPNAPSPTTDGAYVEGWQLVSGVAIVRWDVSGGFEYTASNDGP